MHKQIRKWISAALVASMLVPAVPTGFPGMAAGTVSAAEESQIASPVENVYLNHYSGTARSMDFNNDWKFYLGEAPGAEAKVYNDAEWTTLNVPHDYSIDQEYSNSGEAESGYRLGGVGWYRKTFTVDSDWADKKVTIDFDGVYMDSTVYLNGTKLGGHPYGYTPFSFELPTELLDFEGENVIVVKVNHQTPSSRWYSGSGIYREVYLSVTEKVHIDRYGVSVTTSGVEDGGAADVNIETALVNDGTEEVNGIKLQYTIYKQGETTPVATKEVTTANALAAGNGFVEATTIQVDNPQLWSSWDTGEPNLYVLNTQVVDSEGNKLDEYDTTFGFRYFNFDRNKGFSINGEYIKLKGVCMHHDQGALGAEAWEDAIRRQVIILKGMGCNSIRVTHNPAAQVLIDICNEEGMLIVEEAFDGWDRIKNGNSKDYARFFGAAIEADNNILGKEADMTWAEYDIKSMVLRGKNAPSIIMWSLGNEITEGSSGCDHYPEIAEDLIAWVGEVETDSYRKITFGDNKLKGDNATTAAVANKIHAAGGLVGFNYTDWNTIKNKTNNLGSNSWFVYSSETSSPSISRGVYEVTNGNTSTVKNYAKTSYDTSCVGWGKTASDAWWETVRFDANMGEYIWTGFDYLGEPTPWNGTGTEAHNGRPKSAYFGVVDIAGLPKDPYYLYRSLWYEQEGDYTVHMLPTWDEADVLKDGNGNVRVDVYSNAPKVELVLEKADGTSKVVGAAKTMTTYKSTVGWDSTEGIHSYRTVDGVTQNHQSLYYTWSVPYEEGTLKAVAYDGKGEDAKVIEASKITGRTEVTTTTGQAQLALSVDEYTLEEAETPTIVADGKSLAYVVIEVQDEDGNFVNGAEPEITVEVEGPGKLIGMDNGFQADYTSYQSNVWNAHRGKVVAIIQSTEEAGAVTVTATADEDGVEAGSVTINTVSKEDTSGEVKAVSVEMSKIYYVKKDTKPVFPATLKVHYSDKSFKELPVTWNTEGLSTKEEGTYSVNGNVNNGEVIVAVNLQVIGEVAALQNYSTYMRTGQDPALPGSLPAITAEGEILNAFFNVNWDLSTMNKDVPGTYVVNGTADVFGKEMYPTATVRVSSGVINEGSNVISTRLQTEENLSNPANKELIYDGDKNSAYWQGTGSLKYGWATAENINKVVLYLGDTAPTSDSIKLSWSLAFDGADYTPLDAVVENSRVNGVIVRTYTFNTVPAVGFKIEFEKNVKLYEAELYTGVPSFPVGSTAELEELSVKGKLVDDTLLAIRQYVTTDTDITVEDIVAVGKDNASVTILPEKNSRILILTKSEDGTAQEVYTIELGKEELIFQVDYDPVFMVVNANEENNTTDAVENVLDGDANTIWHTEWDGLPQEDLYIDLIIKEKNSNDELVTLTEPVPITSLRYLPRQGSAINGRVTAYRLEYSVLGDGSDWAQVPGGEGTWANDATWKVAEFDEVKARAIRLYGVETQSDSGKNFMSAAEIRLCAPQKNLNSLVDISLETTEFDYTGVAIRPEPVIQAKEGVVIDLVEGKDYTVEYTNNINSGKAYMTVKGIGEYSGTLRVYYTINERKLEVESYERIAVTTNKGVAPELPGTVTAVLTGGVKKELEVSWPEIAETFYAQAGEFSVKGIVKGTSLSPTARVTVVDIDNTVVVAVEPVAAVTKPATAPELPNTIRVKLADGSYETRTVTAWELEGKDWNITDGGIVKVTGTVENTELPAIAQVRVLGSNDVKNIAVNTAENDDNSYPRPYATQASDKHKIWNPIDGDFTTGTGDDTRWDNWERGLYPTPWYAVQLENNQVITGVGILFADEGSNADNGGVALPTDYAIQYYTGEEFTVAGDPWKVDDWQGSPLLVESNWTTVQYTGNKPSVPAWADFKTQLMKVNFTPVDTDMIRIALTAKENKWTGISELEIYTYDLTKYNTFEVNSIMAGEQDITDNLVNGGVYEYQLAEDTKVPQIQVEATNNALVMVERPKDDATEGMVTITILPEDGSANGKEVYKINFLGSSEDSDVPVVEPNAQIAEVTIDPTTEEQIIIDSGSTMIFEATVIGYGDINKEVEWAVAAVPSEEGETTLQTGTKVEVSEEDANKAILSVDTNESPKQLVVTVTSKGDTTKRATSIVTVVNPAQVNRNALQTLVEVHTGKDAMKYTLKTWKEFEAAFKAAQNVLNNTSATAQQLMEAKENLAVAVNGLKKVAYTVDLQNLVDQSSAKDSVNYTPESWKKFETAFATAKDVLVNRNATQNEVDIAKRNLERAIAALVERDAPSAIWVDGIQSELTYNGSKQTFKDLKVYDGTTLLKEKTDYTVSYKNNQNACEFDENDLATYLEKVEAGKKVSGEGTFVAKTAPQVIIKMKGVYGGTKTIYFQIKKANIENKEEFLIDNLYAAWNGNKQTPTPVITWKATGKTLKLKKEFSVKEYTNPGSYNFKDATTYTLNLHGEGNFTGDTTVEYTIGEVVPLSKVSVSYKKSLKWGIDPADEDEGLKVVVKYKGEFLEEGTDYCIDYDEENAVGTRSFAIIGIEKDGEGEISYTGTRRFTYKVTGTSMSKVKTTKFGKFTYRGEPIELLSEDVDVYYGEEDNLLAPGEQFTVEYLKNTNKGTATMILTGRPEEGFTGVKKVNYKIEAASLNEESFSYELAGEMTEAYYTSGGTTPKVVVTSWDTGAELVEGVDYTLSYKNNKKLANIEDSTLKASRYPTVTIKGKGNFKGSYPMPFSIVQKEVNPEDTLVTISVKDKVYKETPKNWKQSFKVLDENGKVISNKDYTFEYTLEGQTTEIEDKAQLKLGDTIQITVTFKEKNGEKDGNYRGQVVATYRLIEKKYDISKAKIKINNQEYTGDYIEITSKDQFKECYLTVPGEEKPIELEIGKNIIVTGYQKNLNKGTAKVTFRGIETEGENSVLLGGEKTVSFKIVQRDINNNWWDKLSVSVQNLFNF